MFREERKREMRELFFDPQRLEELREGDAVCLGSLPDRFAAGNGAANAAHAELEEGLGCLGLCLEEIIDGTVCGNFCHTVLSLRRKR